MSHAAWSLPEWAYAFGRPAVRGRIRERPEDFQVSEIPLTQPDGEGAHLWLEIEKRGANSDWVARQLSAHAGVPMRDVGFAGRKDRKAIAVQWFSVGLQEADNEDWAEWRIPDVRIRKAARHRRKLKRGALRGNRFNIRVRELSGDVAGLPERLGRLGERGVPNYFGPQRFGFGARNVERGLRWLSARGPLARSKRSLYLSAVRSLLFNDVLSLRVAEGNWDRVLDGELALLAGSRSTFRCTMPDAGLQERCAAFDIHPSGPLPGTGGREPASEAGRIEKAALRPHGTTVDALAQAGLRADRRSLRLRLCAFAWNLAEGELELGFRLAPGAYATSVLRELVSAGDSTISSQR